MRIRLLWLATLVLLAALPAPAQPAEVAQSKQLAETLANASELPINVRLRFQLVRDMVGGIASKGSSDNALAFFSTTRVLFWNRPASPTTGQAMRDLEQRIVALASSKGFHLDLPPVGYSTAGAAGGGMAPPGPAAGPLLVNRSTREGLFELTLRAEEMGTFALANGGTPELLALRDSLTVLRQDLADSQVASDAVRNALLARAVYLASPSSAAIDPQLKQKLDIATEALRTNFPPELLRATRGQTISL
jgi:hypothetical protein